MTSPKRVSSADVDAALGELLAGPSAAFDATWARMREALAVAPAAGAVDVPPDDEEGAPAEGLVIEVQPKGSSTYEVFPVFEVYTDRPAAARGALALALDPRTGDLGLFAPKAWRADWSSVRLRDGRRTYGFAEPAGAALGTAVDPIDLPDLAARVDADTAARLASLTKARGGSKP